MAMNDIDEARAMIEEEKQQRATACIAEIDATLKRHNCQIVTRPIIDDQGRIVATAQIVAL